MRRSEINCHLAFSRLNVLWCSPFEEPSASRASLLCLATENIITVSCPISLPHRAHEFLGSAPIMKERRLYVKHCSILITCIPLSDPSFSPKRASVDAGQRSKSEINLLKGAVLLTRSTFEITNEEGSAVRCKRCPALPWVYVRDSIQERGLI